MIEKLSHYPTSKNCSKDRYSFKFTHSDTQTQITDTPSIISKRNVILKISKINGIVFYIKIIQP